nr:DsbA family protein [uncultured Dyadobacter sp.]
MSKEAYQGKVRIKLTFYTHPLCTASWEMAADWSQFLKDYNGLFSYRYCIGELHADSKELETIVKTPYLCVAVKAASLQSEKATHLYLNALRQAFWGGQADLSDVDQLLKLARQTSQAHRFDFDFNRFAKDLTGKQAGMRLKDDLRKFHINKIGQLPTITFTQDAKGIKLEGRTDYRQLACALSKLLLVGRESSAQSATGHHGNLLPLDKAPAKLIG